LSGHDITSSLDCGFGEYEVWAENIARHPPDGVRLRARGEGLASVAIEAGNVIHHPAAERFPEHSPSGGVRGDQKGYKGVQVRAWADGEGNVHTAVLRPTEMRDGVYQDHLEDLYDALLRYRGEVERIYRTDRETLNTDQVAILDMGADGQGGFGPGFFYDGATVELEDLTEALVYAIRLELMS
jgi:hypothetical protein